MQGPDALDFLHRFTTVNVKVMKPGDGAPGFFLSAQGKIRGFFTLWMTAPSEFVFEFDAGQAGNGKQNFSPSSISFTSVKNSL